jgi:hypothetical protein
MNSMAFVIAVAYSLMVTVNTTIENNLSIQNGPANNVIDNVTTNES